MHGISNAPKPFNLDEELSTVAQALQSA